VHATFFSFCLPGFITTAGVCAMDVALALMWQLCLAAAAVQD
jgi:hypothetical protein